MYRLGITQLNSCFHRLGTAGQAIHRRQETFSDGMDGPSTVGTIGNSPGPNATGGTRRQNEPPMPGEPPIGELTPVGTTTQTSTTNGRRALGAVGLDELD
jgi:hypothetical protein